MDAFLDISRFACDFQKMPSCRCESPCPRQPLRWVSIQSQTFAKIPCHLDGARTLSKACEYLEPSNSRHIHDAP